MKELTGKKGRPKGSYTRPQFHEYVTNEEIIEFIGIAKKQAKKDPIMLKFLLEQVFGRASQNVNLGGQEDNPLEIGVIMYPHPQKNENTLATTTEAGDSTSK